MLSFWFQTGFLWKYSIVVFYTMYYMSELGKESNNWFYI